VTVSYTENDLQGLNNKACHLLTLYQGGLVSEHILYIYGISGKLPDRETYYQMSEQEVEVFWDKKMSSKFGKRWRNIFTKLPDFLQKRDFFESNCWITEGF